MGRRRQEFENKLDDIVVFNPWTVEELVATRKRFKLRQRDISEAIGMTVSSIAMFERGKVNSPWIEKLYGLILERYYAAQLGYIPAFKKLGQNQFIGEDVIHKDTLEKNILDEE